MGDEVRGKRVFDTDLYLKVQTISGLQAGQALSFTQNYTYDSLSRLRTVKDSGLA